MLVELDTKWVLYEKSYVFELMVIEIDARRYIVESIEIEKKIQNFEKTYQKRGVSISIVVRDNRSQI